MPRVISQQIPRHVAIIMDGNGRWAIQRGLPRSAGHKVGIEALRRAVRAAPELGIEYLSVYSFSTENWKRPKTEVKFLLNLLKRFIKQDVAELHAAGVRIIVIGKRNDLEPSLVVLLNNAESLTRENTKLKLIVAFNYGAKQELAHAAQALATAAVAGRINPQDITVDMLEQALETAAMPNVDLLIRTGGEQRISNFLLWQCAYAEFIFIPLFWPDFDGTVLQRAVAEFQARDRRFGGVRAEIE